MTLWMRAEAALLLLFAGNDTSSSKRDPKQSCIMGNSTKINSLQFKNT